MNKDLIKKYKAEFDWWLNEGKLLCYTEFEGPYHPVDESYWDYPADIGFIIDDEYVEFRKALAEGKTVQKNVSYTKAYPAWTDTNATDMLNYTATVLRIKPDEPKYKVGDWVYTPAVVNNISTHLIARITQTNPYQVELFTNNYSSVTVSWDDRDSVDVRPWNPQPGEWCLFWDDGFTVAALARFLEMQGREFLDHNVNRFEHCQPFIGNLPTHLQ